MGTRGAYGVRIDDTDKITYNHFDSYPGYLGKELITLIQTARDDWGKDGVIERARALELVESDSTPTEEQIEQLSEYADQGVSTGKLTEWYVLLREMQGDIYAHLKEGVMVDEHTFMADSLFCEWAYIINLDNDTLEVYRGFQKQPHERGRYCDMDARGDYEPVALKAEFDLWEVDEKMVEALDRA